MQLFSINIMSENKNYKETREAYAVILEKIVEASLRLGLDINSRQQSALSMLLQGSSYNEIASVFDMKRSEAISLTKSAISELESFLDHLQSIEEIKKEAEEKLTEEQNIHYNRIRELNKEINDLTNQIYHYDKETMEIPIHRLDIPRILQSVLMRAGYNNFGDIIKEDERKISKLPGMTPDFMRSLQYLICHYLKD